MSRYLLDTSALLTLRDDEPGADVVADLLYQAQQGDVTCFASFMTQMELLVLLRLVGKELPACRVRP